MPPLLVDFNDVLRVVEMDVEGESVKPVLFESTPQFTGILRVCCVGGAFDRKDDVRRWIGEMPYGSAESMCLMDQPCIDSCHGDDDTNGRTRSDGSLVGKGDLDLVSRSNVDAHFRQGT